LLRKKINQKQEKFFRKSKKSQLWISGFYFGLIFTQAVSNQARYNVNESIDRGEMEQHHDE